MASITSGGSNLESILRQILQQNKDDAEAQADVQERIQQQLAKVNEDENLAEGERHYG